MKKANLIILILILSMNNIFAKDQSDTCEFVDTIECSMPCLIFFHPSEEEYRDSLKINANYAELESDFSYTLLQIRDSIKNDRMRLLVTEAKIIVLEVSKSRSYVFDINKLKKLYGFVYYDGINKPKVSTEIFPPEYYYEIINSPH